MKLERENSIVVDGELNEAAWQQAAVLSPLTQVLPVEAAKPTVKTKIRLCYDRDHLYLAFECFDDPKAVRARIQYRDANLNPDDRVEWWIDTFNDHRFGFWFQIGPGGSKGDALISGGGSIFNKDWDGIWHGKAKLTARGWQAEIALPFKTLSFKKGASTWGFNIRRLRKANDEDDRWAAPTVAHRFFRLAVGGTLVGMSGMQQGLGVEFVPYYKARLSRDRRVNKHSARTGDFGADLSYRITPALRFQLTYNTDFAETEVDERRVNLTRFPLFFPEKRDFFLEDAGLFEFGSPDRRRQVVPFFSRRIGRDDRGETIPILTGARLTGRAGAWNIGSLGIVTDRNQGVPEKGMGVLRISRNLGEESSIGMIATAGRPLLAGQASTFGLDLKLSDSTAFGDKEGFNLWTYALGSSSDGSSGDGRAYGMHGEINTRNWVHRFAAHAVEKDFNPELGFVRRMGTRSFEVMTRYSWHGEGHAIRRLSFRTAPSFTTLENGEIDSWEIPLRWFGIEFESGDEIEFETRRVFEHIPKAFNIFSGIDVSSGDYTMTRHFLDLEFSDRRVLAGDIGFEFGDFFSGSITKFSIEPSFFPSSFLTVSGSYEENRVRLNEGNFIVRVSAARIDLQFSPDLSWRNLVQYDTESKNLGFQSRWRWIIEPGKELLLVGGYGWNRDRHAAPFIPEMQDLVIKLVYNFRF